MSNDFRKYLTSFFLKLFSSYSNSLHYTNLTFYDIYSRPLVPISNPPPKKEFKKHRNIHWKKIIIEEILLRLNILEIHKVKDILVIHNRSRTNSEMALAIVYVSILSSCSRPNLKSSWFYPNSVTNKFPD